MYVSSSSHVVTPGVESGATKSGQEHFGYAPTSLHMVSQTPAILFCTFARCSISVARQAFSFASAEIRACKLDKAMEGFIAFCNTDAVLPHFLSISWPQAERLLMCSRSSSHVITPGVASGGTKAGQ